MVYPMIHEIHASLHFITYSSILRLTADMVKTLPFFSYIALLVFCNRDVLSLYPYSSTYNVYKTSTGTSCIYIMSLSVKWVTINI